MWLAQAVSFLIIGYTIFGVVFAIYFVSSGVNRVDSSAKGSTMGFRLIILPGAVLLWPLLLGRIVRGITDPPEERNAHRILARRARGQQE